MEPSKPQEQETKPCPDCNGTKWLCQDLDSPHDEECQRQPCLTCNSPGRIPAPAETSEHFHDDEERCHGKCPTCGNQYTVWHSGPNGTWRDCPDEFHNGHAGEASQPQDNGDEVEQAINEILRRHDHKQDAHALDVELIQSLIQSQRTQAAEEARNEERKRRQAQSYLMGESRALHIALQAIETWDPHEAQLADYLQKQAASIEVELAQLDRTPGTDKEVSAGSVEHKLVSFALGLADAVGGLMNYARSAGLANELMDWPAVGEPFVEELDVREQAAYDRGRADADKRFEKMVDEVWDDTWFNWKDRARASYYGTDRRAA